MVGETSTDDTRPKFPAWASKPFMDFLDFVEHMQEVSDISAAGIAMLTKHSKLFEAGGPMGRPDYEARLDESRRITALAQRELERGFPLLYSQVTVALWSGLENMATNLIVAFLLNDRGRVLAHDAMKSVKVPIGEYGRLTHEQQAEYLAELIDRTTTAPLKEGATRFDALLEVLGIVTPLDDRVRRHLFEMGQVRNVIVHRGSVVDRRLAENCPWLAVKPGEELRVMREQLGAYFSAAIEFCGARLWATRRSLGIPDPKPELGDMRTPRA